MKTNRNRPTTLRLSAIAAIVAVLAASSLAQTKFILRYTDSEPLQDFLARYQLTLEDSIPGRPVHAVIDPLGRDPDSLIAQIDNDDDDDDVSIEQDQILRLPVFSFTTPQEANAANLARAAQLTSVVGFFGARVPRGFPTQIAAVQTRANLSWRTHGLGPVLVAVVDTGVDPSHLVFNRAVLPGIDLLQPGANGSELNGLTPEIRALVNPTTTPLLFRPRRHLSNGHAPFWENSVTTNANFNQMPRGLGHGTMVAGAIRLVAPNARILPIRAFNQDGTGRLYHVVRAIHEARARGARVVNLSLNTLQPSPELSATAEEVSNLGTILVASTGNDGLTNIPSYPASIPRVTGVAAIGPNNVRSIFSNAGPDLTWVAAPGEALYLPFPGNRFAGGWGTSFSAPLVAGLAAKIVAQNPNATYSDLQSALGRSTPLNDPNLGLGALEVFNSMTGL